VSCIHIIIIVSYLGSCIKGLVVFIFVKLKYQRCHYQNLTRQTRMKVSVNIKINYAVSRITILKHGKTFLFLLFFLLLSFSLHSFPIHFLFHVSTSNINVKFIVTYIPYQLNVDVMLMVIPPNLNNLTQPMLT
jgi:hypothetical protein